MTLFIYSLEFCFWHRIFCAMIFASISPRTTRSAESAASSSSDKQFASWQAIVDKIYRLLQFDIMNHKPFCLLYATDYR